LYSSEQHAEWYFHWLYRQLLEEYPVNTVIDKYMTSEMHNERKRRKEQNKGRTGIRKRL
jgi:hypothetical protein